MLSSKSKKRFTLLHLKDGEVYYEDFSCNYFPPTTGGADTKRKKIKGRLKFCSHSLIFVPDDRRVPVIKFPYKFIQGDKASGFVVPPSQEQSFLGHQPDELFSIKITETIEMNENNEPHPYRFKKSSTPQLHVFGLLYVDPILFLSRLNELLHISKLPTAERDVRLYKINHARENNFAFDITWLHDLREEQIYETTGDKIAPLVSQTGRIMITNARIYFQPFSNISNRPVKKFDLSDITRIVKRRYMLRQIGLEIFTKQNKTVFFAFESTVERERVYDVISRQPALTNLHIDDQTNMTLKWQNGLISNFDYLMYLNFMADRTFKDLTQYPVFPWVIQDFSSDKLNLQDPNTFRDLSKPIGALNPQRLEMLKQRYEDMPDPKFLYGTHYSTPGYVLYYLVRQAPEYMLRLQNGKFDDPDRLFDSVASCWHSCLNSPADVKELIPEFYQGKGEFLVNSRGLDLGIKQSGQKVNDVILPPWAKDPADFIRQCRLALESDYVSQHLHNWIDLIFGYKQRGEAAVEADNVFYYLTYEGAINIEEIKDEHEKRAIKQQISEFGQTPKQLFKAPHPKRLKSTDQSIIELALQTNEIPLDPIASHAKSAISTPTVAQQIDAFDDASFSPLTRKSSSLHSMDGNNSLAGIINKTSTTDISDSFESDGIRKSSSERSAIDTGLDSSSNNGTATASLRTLKAKHTEKLHRDKIASCVLNKAGDTLYTASSDTTCKIYSLADCKQLRRIIDMGDMALSSCVLAPQNEKTLIVSSWDNNIYVYSVSYGRILDTLSGHVDAVSALCVNDTRLLSASWDGSIKMWNILPSSVSKIPVMEFTEHETEVKCIAFNSTGTMAASGSADGVVMLWDIRAQRSISSFRAHSEAVSCVSFAPDDSGRVISSSTDQLIKIFETNGSEICLWHAQEGVRTHLVHGSTLLSGGDSGILRLWNLNDSTEICSFTGHKAAVSSLCISQDGSSVVSGADDGEMIHWKVH